MESRRHFAGHVVGFSAMGPGDKELQDLYIYGSITKKKKGENSQ